MPIYEYRRPDGSTFELMQSFSEDPLTHDPETGDPVQRVLHAPAVHFKGSGFYNTDYGTRRRQRENASSDGAAGGAGDAPAAKNGASEDASSSTKAESGSEKTAAKPEPKASAKAGSAVGAS